MNRSYKLVYTPLNTCESCLNLSTVLYSKPEKVQFASYVYILIGLFMVLVFVCGLLENSGVLYIFARNRKLWTCRNGFLVGLSVGDFCQTILNIPFVIVSSFCRRWIFGYGMCQYYAFVTSTLGLAQISLLTTVALDRYLLIVHHRETFSRSPLVTLVTILSCFLHGAVWSLGPLLGWSRFQLEAGELSCTIDWNLHEARNLSYVISLFVCVWFLPLSVISYSYSNIVYLVSPTTHRHL